MTNTTNNYDPGLLERLFGGIINVFRPQDRDGDGRPDPSPVSGKFVLDFLFNVILAVGAYRMIDEMLRLSGGNWPLSIFMVAFSEGGFVGWKVAWRDPRSNTSQRGLAITMMVIHGVVSILFTVANFIEQALGSLTINDASAATPENVAIALGVSVGVVIVANFIAIPLFLHFDDEDAAERTHQKAMAQLKRKERADGLTMRRAEQEADVAENMARTTAKTQATIALAPILATLHGLDLAEEEIRKKFGNYVPEDILSEILRDLYATLPAGLAQQFAANSALDQVEQRVKQEEITNNLSRALGAKKGFQVRPRPAAGTRPAGMTAVAQAPAPLPGSLPDARSRIFTEIRQLTGGAIDAAALARALEQLAPDTIRLAASRDSQAQGAVRTTLEGQGISPNLLGYLTAENWEQLARWSEQMSRDEQTAWDAAINGSAPQPLFGGFSGNGNGKHGGAGNFS